MADDPTITEALNLMAGLVLANGARWGDVAVEAQREDARAILDQANGQPYHFCTRARGYSKSDDLAGMATVAMLTQLPAASRLFALAADKDQGRLLIDSIAGFRARTPGLAGALRVDAYRVTATRSASTLEVIAADAPSAYGLRPALLIVDELAQWATTSGARQLWEASTSALAKIPGARMVVLTSAGDPAHWSHAILDHARSDPLWRVHEVPGPPPWADPARLAEQRRRLPESIYARLFENRWTSAEDRLTNLDDLAACTTLDGPQAPVPGTRYAIGLDLGIKADRTAAAVMHVEASALSWDGDQQRSAGRRAVLDRLGVWKGNRLKPVSLDEVEKWVLQASGAYGGAPVVVDPWQAVGMAQRLRGAGVKVIEFTFSSASVGRLAATLHNLLRSRCLALPDDADLLDELANVRLRETSPGVIRMDHDAGRHDDRAIALALAAQHLLERPERTRPMQRSYPRPGGGGGAEEVRASHATSNRRAQYRHDHPDLDEIWRRSEAAAAGRRPGQR